MTAYTDGTHLVADSRAELHAFAAFAGIARYWFHRDHYDLNERRLTAALVKGARYVRPRDVVVLLRATGQRRRKRRLS